MKWLKSDVLLVALLSAGGALAMTIVGVFWHRVQLRLETMPDPPARPATADQSPPLTSLTSEDTSALRVVDTVPLELGEGDDRTGSCEVRLKNGLGVHRIPVGTRIEQLEDDGRAPKGMRLIRVSTSKYHGIVGYAWAYQIQAAR